MSPESSGGRKRRLKGHNILDLVPVRNPGFAYSIRNSGSGRSGPGEPGDAGTVSISVPRFKGRMGRGFCKLIGVKPQFNVNLDAYGSFVWLLVDGKTTVRDLAVEVGTRFGDKVEPLYGRLAHFLSLLERNRLVTYVNLPPTPSKKRRKKK